jgi:hypothetical protein
MRGLPGDLPNDAISNQVSVIAMAGTRIHLVLFGRLNMDCAHVPTEEAPR